MKRAVTSVVAGLAVAASAALAAGCAAPGPAAPAGSAGSAGRPAAEAALSRAGTANAAAGQAAAAGGAQPAATCDPSASSLAPSGPPEVTPGSYMAKIKQRGYLIAGVDQSTYHFGYLNPLNGQIEGFDIDMVRAVAQAIFGDPNKIQYKAISDADRISAITSGSVDIVAHTMTITCGRLEQVDFSSVYFEAHQKVLVPSDVQAPDGLDDLGGKKVCTTTGSDSADKVRDYPVTPKPTVVQRPFWTDCLVLLQQNQVAAVSTDDAILYGLQAQDPFTKVVGGALTNEPYGLAMPKQHPDFVKFVNAVIATYESGGTKSDWETSYLRWVSPVVASPPPLRYAS